MAKRSIGSASLTLSSRYSIIRRPIAGVWRSIFLRGIDATQVGAIGQSLVARQAGQPNTSLHLRHLRQIGIVHRTREGRVATYRIGNTVVADLCDTVCQDH
ncbi:helix-turn-helix transcriptional regulator [Thiomonas sp. X19]|uniref:ArsR/SmtB family transcription factor n=1 Tax=Thiomonas sp. X19 TaxID=1050370 RepID=UPI0011BE77E8|nr:helix-turn-helix transcriptional regulator [Thiomonas sp. X19]